MTRPSVIALGLAFLAGCASVPKGAGEAPAELKTLLDAACSPGTSVASMRGSVWLKAKSSEASGQFPAGVEATDPGKLLLEITNLVGGTEARIRVDDRHYRIEVPGKPRQDREGWGAWGGIPLEWATELFIGRVPCPPASDRAEARLSMSGEDLVVETPHSLEREAEKFVFGFRKWGGQPWPERLRWERAGAMPLVVEFKFDDPDDATHSPRRWEAKSAQGEVKVRWKDREPKLRDMAR
jgi:hypothetical protein